MTAAISSSTSFSLDADPVLRVMLSRVGTHLRGSLSLARPPLFISRGLGSFVFHPLRARAPSAPSPFASHPIPSIHPLIHSPSQSSGHSFPLHLHLSRYDPSSLVTCVCSHVLLLTIQLHLSSPSFLLLQSLQLTGLTPLPPIPSSGRNELGPRRKLCQAGQAGRLSHTPTASSSAFSHLFEENGHLRDFHPSTTASSDVPCSQQ